MKQNAIVTLAIGDNFKARWESLCRKNWDSYAKSIGCDLVVLDQIVDESARAASRSPSWQKLLLLDHPAVRDYDQIAWVDCDIFFNPFEPKSLFESVPREKVGAVNSFADPSPEANAIALERLWKLASAGNPGKRVKGQYSSPDEIYLDYGKPVEPVGKMLNAGLLVASPRHHTAVFRHVYDHYEDRGDPSYYENVPLSHDLVKNDLVHWMDPRFNHLWAWDKLLHYPFLQEWSKRSILDKFLRRAAKWLGNDYENRVAARCATTSLLNCYCLHFAGCAAEMSLVDLESAARGVVGNLGV